jgi:regulator of sirC expression with transglutaminase-like and TPR domain
VRELADLLARNDESVPLDVAALQLATIEYPDITVEPFRMLLDSYARELGQRVSPSADGEEFIGTFNEYLFDELGFEGNDQDYYDPANSCLNEVLTRRKGIPITLSLVCIEIARRLQRPITAIGLPGHFIVRYDDGKFATYIDPFNNGQLLFETECYDLARRATGLQLRNDRTLLAPVGTRQIIVRMLNNLRSAYFLRQDPQKALKVLDLLIQADPSSAEEYKQRGIFRARLHLYQSARTDFETYLKLAPDAPDREDVAKQLNSLQAWLRKLQ